MGDRDPLERICREIPQGRFRRPDPPRRLRPARVPCEHARGYHRPKGRPRDRAHGKRGGLLRRRIDRGGSRAGRRWGDQADRGSGAAPQPADDPGGSRDGVGRVRGHGPSSVAAGPGRRLQAFHPGRWSRSFASGASSPRTTTPSSSSPAICVTPSCMAHGRTKCRRIWSLSCSGSHSQLQTVSPSSKFTFRDYA